MSSTSGDSWSFSIVDFDSQTAIRLIQFWYTADIPTVFSFWKCCKTAISGSRLLTIRFRWVDHAPHVTGNIISCGTAMLSKPVPHWVDIWVGMGLPCMWWGILIHIGGTLNMDSPVFEKIIWKRFWPYFTGIHPHPAIPLLAKLFCCKSGKRKEQERSFDECKGWMK